VAQGVPVFLTIDHDMATRHRDVVEEDVGVGMTTDRRRRFFEPERRTLARTVAHHEQPDAGRQLFEIALELLLDVCGLDRRQREGRFVVDPAQGRAARRTEAGVVLVLVTAAGAEHKGAAYRGCDLDLNLRWSFSPR